MSSSSFENTLNYLDDRIEKLKEERYYKGKQIDKLKDAKEELYKINDVCERCMGKKRINDGGNDPMGDNKVQCPDCNGTGKYVPVDKRNQPILP